MEGHHPAAQSRARLQAVLQHRLQPPCADWVAARRRGAHAERPGSNQQSEAGRQPARPIFFFSFLNSPPTTATVGDVVPTRTVAFPSRSRRTL